MGFGCCWAHPLSPLPHHTRDPWHLFARPPRRPRRLGPPPLQHLHGRTRPRSGPWPASCRPASASCSSAWCTTRHARVTACHRSPLDARHSQGPADPLEPAARELGRTPCARGSPVSASTRDSRRADDGSFSSVRKETTLVPEEPTRSHLSGRSVRNSTRVGVGDTQLLQAPLARPVFSYGHVDEGAGGGGSEEGRLRDLRRMYLTPFRFYAGDAHHGGRRAEAAHVVHRRHQLGPHANRSQIQGAKG
jgi:hypothetical protein